VPQDGNITIETRGDSGDVAMAVYGGSCSNLIEISCRDNSGTSNHPKIELDNAALAGLELYVRVWGVNDEDIFFDIAAYNINLFTPAAALDFDGVDDVINVNGGVDLANKSFTIEYYAKRNAINSQGYIISQGQSSTNQGLFTGFRNNNNVVFGFWDNELEAGNITDNNWHHYAMVFDVDDNKKQIIYIDGVEAGSRNATENYMYSGSNPLILGTLLQFDAYFSGSVDEFRIWDKALTVEEINDKINCELIDTEIENLVTYYSFNQGYDNFANEFETLLLDNSTNGYNGNLINFDLTGTTSNWVSNAGIVLNTFCYEENNECITAETLQVGFDFNTYPKLNVNNRAYFDSNISTPYCGNYQGRDIWYKLTVPNDGKVTIETNGDGSDTAMAVYGGSCNNLILITCDDNSGTNNYAKVELNHNGLVGQEIYVRVWGVNDEDVNYDISAYNPAIFDAGSSLNFDGVDNIINVNGGVDLANKSFTIEYYAKRDIINNQGYIISQGQSSANQGLFTGFRNNNNVVFGFWDNELEAGTITDTNWHHYAMVFDIDNNRKQTIYIDGVETGSRNATANYIYPGTNPLIIGNLLQFDTYFSGSVDELRIWESALTPAEINNKINCELTGDEMDLLVYYNFNQGTDSVNNTTETTLIDGSPNVKNGILENFTLNGTTSNWIADTDVDGCSIQLSAKIYLQGAILNPNTGEELLMRDDLRLANLIPTTSPYADGLTCDASVFSVANFNAIVDWVWVELRDKTDNTVIVYSQSALLQRDGDLVDIDGISILNLSLNNDDYYVTIHHRNHFGIMTASPISLSRFYRCYKSNNIWYWSTN